MKNEKIKIGDWLKTVGRDRFQEDLGRSTQLVTRALDDGQFPSSWYIGVRSWCYANNHPFPEHLFKMADLGPSRTDGKQNANYNGVCQVSDVKSNTSVAQ